MHCQICDFSNTLRSDYYESLYNTQPEGNSVLLDAKVDQYLCVDCLGESLTVYSEMQEEDEERAFAKLTVEIQQWEEELLKHATTTNDKDR